MAWAKRTGRLPWPLARIDRMHSPDTRADSTLRGPGEFSRAAIVVLFVVLMGVVSIPIVSHTLPPFSDYLNHLGRTYVINHIGTDPDFARFYFVKWQVVPNLMIDAAMLVLNPIIDIYRAGQVFTLAAFILILAGTLALNRALFGYWSALPLVAAPLLYNEVLLVGVMNYIFGIGLVLWALAAWVALRDRPWPWRIGVSTLLVLALFFCHLYAVGVYGLALFGFELQRLWAKRAEPFLPNLVEFMTAGLPFLLIIVLLGISPTWRSVGDYYWTANGKIDGLFMAVDVYYSVFAFGLMASVLVAGTWALRNRMLHFHPAGWAILAVGGVVYLAMPRSLFAAHMADQRLPIALAFVFIACLRLEFRHRRVRQMFVAMLVVLLAVRVTEVQLVWNRLGLVTAEFHRSVMLIERGARVLVVHADRSSGEDVSDYELVHAASIATIERSALVSTMFTVLGKQPLQVRDEFRRYVETEDRTPPSIPYFLEAARNDVPYFFSRWPKHFDYVYILFTKRGAANPDPKDMTGIFDGPSFQLYRVMRDG
jgi:hypothetical protein